MRHYLRTFAYIRRTEIKTLDKARFNVLVSFHFVWMDASWMLENILNIKKKCSPCLGIKCNVNQAKDIRTTNPSAKSFRI